jgi:DNA-binding MarR family transcriptional regulator
VETSIPQNLVDFIRTCIDGLGTLEILFLLSATPGRSWTIQQISDEMRSSTLAVESSLAVLVDRGLVSRNEDGYLFQPRTIELENRTRELVACYREKRAAVITTIFARPAEAVRSFAEAFRIKKGRA